MADSVANLPISNSYVGLLRISNDATGVPTSPAPVYTSDGAETVLSLGKNSATIDGRLTADNISAEYITVDNITVTNTTTTPKLMVTGETTFVETITFSKVSTTPGVINEEDVIFENRGTFKSTSTGTFISKGTADFARANFATLSCSGNAIFNGSVSLWVYESNAILTIASNEITARSEKFTVNAGITDFNNSVRFKNLVNLGSYATAVTPAASDSSTKVATTAFVKSVIPAEIPVGTIQIYAGRTAPAGYLLCHGQEISKSTYKELFAVIKDTYGGSGDKFKLPDFRGMFLRGYDAGRGIDSGRELGSRQQSGAPNIKGQFPQVKDAWEITGGYNGAFSQGPGTKLDGAPGDHDSGAYPVLFNASSSSTVYQDGLTEVRPENIAINYIIKY